MRYIILMQLFFFMAYGVVSGAAFHELYDEKIEAINKTHQEKLAGILVLLPVERLSEVKVSGI